MEQTSPNNALVKNNRRRTRHLSRKSSYGQLLENESEDIDPMLHGSLVAVGENPTPAFDGSSRRAASRSIVIPPGSLEETEEYSQSVLLTGGVGFVGSHICEGLLREGRKVVVYDMFNSETTKAGEKHEIADEMRATAEDCKAFGAELFIITGDIRDRELLEATIIEHDISGCIHVGGMVDDRRSVSFPEEYIDVNIRGTCILLDTLGKCGVKMVVQASTRSVFGQRDSNDVFLDERGDRRPINPYGATKVGSDAMAHCYCHLHGMNVTLIRIFATYGPRGRPDMIPRILVENIADDKPIKKFGDGTATRTWIYVSDIVSAFLLALKKPQGGFAEFNTGAENSTTLNELIDAAEKACEKKAIIEHYPVPKGDAHFVGQPKYDRIKEVLGWEPKVDVYEGLRLGYLDYLQRKEKKQNAAVNSTDAINLRKNPLRLSIDDDYIIANAMLKTETKRGGKLAIAFQSMLQKPIFKKPIFPKLRKKRP